MTTTSKVIHTAIAVALLAFAGCATPSHAPRAWDYRAVEGYTRQPERAEFERQLNEAGGQGYAIVSTTTLPGDANNAPRTIVILKRPKP